MESTRVERLPVFALNTVLFPRGTLAVKVFEPRYVEMTKACLRDDTPFGVCCIREGNEVGAPALIATVGCTARIADWELPHPNVFHLGAQGEQRFRVVASEVDSLGLIVCEAELLAPGPTTEAPDALCRHVLATVIAKVGAERFPGPVELDDADWVSYRLAEVMPIAATVRQQLLETDSAHARLKLLHDLLVEAGAVGPS